MKIIFVLSTSYTSNNKRYEKPNSYQIDADILSYLPSLFNYRCEDQKEREIFHKDYINIYNLSSDISRSNKEILKFNGVDSLLNSIFDKCNLIFKKINSVKLTSTKFKNSTYRINLRLIGHRFVWQAFNALCNDKVVLVKPDEYSSDVKIFHRIPELETRIAKLKNGDHISEFKFEGLLMSSHPVEGLKSYRFDKDIQKFNQLNKILEQIIKNISKIDDTSYKNIRGCRHIQLWLSNVLHSIQHTMVISTILREELDKHKNGQKNFERINSLAYIWNSFLYELLKPWKGQYNTLPIVLYNLKNDPKIANELKNFNYLNLQINKIKKNKYKTTILDNDFKSFLEILETCRMKTFHLDKKYKDIDSIEHEYNMCYMTHDLWWNFKPNYRIIIDYIDSIDAFILNVFFLIWQIYNSKCGNSILGPAIAIKERYKK